MITRTPAATIVSTVPASPEAMLAAQRALEEMIARANSPKPLKSTLLTPDGYSPKTDKGHARDVATAILYIAPSVASGIANTCSHASDGCKDACLYKAGRGAMFTTEAARIARTAFLKFNRHGFNTRLIRETQSHVERAARKGMAPAERLNGTSDLPWESFAVNATGQTIMDLYPNVQFYDYTKNPHRALKHARGEMPANYHLTFSRSETNAEWVERVLAAGGSVAVVFKICDCRRPCHHEIPEDTYTYMGRPVINGDRDDLRFLDPANVIVGLKAKGPAKSDTSGFVVDIAECEIVSSMARAA